MDWFSNNNLENISITCLAEALNSKEKIIQLPSFQRDPVWNEERVEALWDSVIREFPIGSLMFASRLNKFGTKALSSSFTSRPEKLQKYTEKTKYIIIDGQQRCIALALGFRPWSKGDTARLWLDIGYNEENSKEQYKFRFYICNNRKPWGINVPRAKLREILKSLKREEDYDRETDEELLLKTWPLRAKIPVSFYEFTQEIIKNKLSDWTNFLPENLPEHDKEKYTGSQIDIDKITDKLLKIAEYKIPVCLIRGLENLEELATAFHRLNKQGVPMSDEDLFFSGLKVKWEDANDLVGEVYEDKETGRVLSPTQIVHNVVRLSATYSNGGKSTDVPKLDLDGFQKLIGRLSLEDNLFLKKLKSYLEKNPTENVSKYNSLLRKAKSLLIFKKRIGSDTADIGLPITLLVRLHKRVWHTITAWLDNNQIDTETDIGIHSRLEMIRYALFDHFYIEGQSTSFLTLPFKKVIESNKNIFPGKDIFNELRGSNQFYNGIKLLTPKEYESRLEDEKGNPMSDILHNERDLIMWNQRDYLHNWFPTFDPTLYKGSEDLPYDGDHIIARYYFDMRGRPHIGNVLPGQFGIIKSRLMNCSGNLRFWPNSLNRSDQYSNLEDKFIIGDSTKETPESSYLRKFHLKTIGEVRKASIIDESSLTYWDSLPKKHQDWLNSESRDAFIKAIQHRRLQNYKNLYCQLRWNDWLS